MTTNNGNVTRRPRFGPPVGTRHPESALAGTGIGKWLMVEREYQEDLRGELLYQQIDRMRRSDPQVKAILSVLKMPILSASWHVQPAEDTEKDNQVAEWLEKRLFEGMSMPWPDLLRHFLLYLDFGTMPFEMVWSVEDDQEFRRPLAVVDLSPRMPYSIYEWRLNDRGELASIEQWGLLGEEVYIPANRLLVFVNEQEASNYRGVSILRAARKPWLLKERAEIVNNIALEKRAIGVDVGTLENTGEDSSDREDAEDVLMGLRSEERAYVLETQRFKYRVQGIEGNVLDPLPTIQYYDSMIATSIVAEFLAMGKDDTGSYAMHRDKSTFFLMLLDSVAGHVESVVNRQLIPMWVRYNFPNVEAMPMLQHGRMDRRDISVFTEALTKLLGSNVIEVTPALRAEVAEVMDLPDDQPEPVDEPEPESVPTPGDPDEDPEESPQSPPDPEEQRRRAGDRRRVRAAAPRPGHERVDYVALASSLDDAEASIVREYLPIQRRQVSALVKAAVPIVVRGDVEALGRLAVPNKDRAAKAFYGPLQSLYRKGKTEVEREVGAVRAAGLDPQDGADVTRWLIAKSQVIAEALALRLHGSMRRVALDAMRRGESAREARTRLNVALTVLSDREVKREASSVTSEALNIGREAAAQANRDRVKSVEYSAVLDDHTCDPCGALDGTTYEMGDARIQAVAPPYKGCSGFGNPRCRCVLVYTVV